MRRPASYVDLLIAFEARKRSASPFKCTPLNISLPFSFIDAFRKYRGKEVEAAIQKHNDPHIRWSSQGMLRYVEDSCFSVCFLSLKYYTTTIKVHHYFATFYNIHTNGYNKISTSANREQSSICNV